MAQNKPPRSNSLLASLLVLLGASTLLLPVYWAGALLLLSFLFSMAILHRIGWNQVVWMFPLFLVTMCSFGVLLIHATDYTLLWRSFQASCSQESCFGFVRVAVSLFSPIFRSLRSYLPLLFFGVLLSAFCSNVLLRDRYRFGVGIGALCSGSIMIGQYFGLIAVPHYGNWHFWESIQRFSGILSDPNALGITAYLICAIFAIEWVRSRHWLYMSIIGLWIFLGLVSGSRTFILGIIAALCVLLTSKDKRIFWGVICSSILILGFLFSFQSNSIFQQDIHLPLALKRVIETATLSGGFFSRKVFWHVATILWARYPLAGIGVGQFMRHFTEVSAELGYTLNGWTDNPNSFYLQILVELGIIGFFALVFSTVQFKFGQGRTLETSCTVGFLVQLLVGPHLQFLEVALISPLLLSYGIVSVDRESKFFLRSGSVFAGALLIGFLLRFPATDYGTFRESKDSLWVMREGQFTVFCDHDVAELSVFTPYSSEHPLAVHITSVGTDHSLLFTKSDTMSLQIVCTKFQDHYLPVTVSIACSRFWLPHLQHQGGDVRPRCVQVKVAGGVYG